MNKGYISLALVVALFLLPACGDSQKTAAPKASKKTVKKTQPVTKKARRNSSKY